MKMKTVLFSHFDEMLFTSIEKFAGEYLGDFAKAKKEIPYHREASCSIDSERD